MNNFEVVNRRRPSVYTEKRRHLRAVYPSTPSCFDEGLDRFVGQNVYSQMQRICLSNLTYPAVLTEIRSGQHSDGLTVRGLKGLLQLISYDQRSLSADFFETIFTGTPHLEPEDLLYKMILEESRLVMRQEVHDAIKRSGMRGIFDVIKWKHNPDCREGIGRVYLMNVLGLSSSIRSVCSC